MRNERRGGPIPNKEVRNLVQIIFTINIGLELFLSFTGKDLSNHAMLEDLFVVVSIISLAIVSLLILYLIKHRADLKRRTSGRLSQIQLQRSIFLFVAVAGAAECTIIAFDQSTMGLFETLFIAPTIALVMILFLRTRVRKTGPMDYEH